MDTVGSYDNQKCLAAPCRFRIAAIASTVISRMIATKLAVMQKNVDKASVPRSMTLRGVQPYRRKMYPKIGICMSVTATRKLVDSLYINPNSARRVVDGLPYKHIQSPRTWINQRNYRSLSTNAQSIGSLRMTAKPTGDDVIMTYMSTMNQPQSNQEQPVATPVEVDEFNEAVLEPTADPYIDEDEITDPYWNIHDSSSQAVSEGNSPNAFDAEDHEVTWKWKH